MIVKMRKKTLKESLGTCPLAIHLCSISLLLCILSLSANTSPLESDSPSNPNQRWSYARVKRQIFREDIPQHRPLTGNAYAQHHGFPHPGRWHRRPQSVLPPNPNSGHHFDDPNVIITDDDFNRYGSTLQHIDHQINGGYYQPQPVALPLQHPPPPPIHGHGQGLGPRKRRPVKILVHHHVHPTIHTKPIVHRFPIEYGKLIPISDNGLSGGLSDYGGGGGGVVTTIGEGAGLDGPVLPILAAHHHNTQQHFEGEGPSALSYAQEYKNVVVDHEHREFSLGREHREPLSPLKPKHLFHRLKFPPGYGKFSNSNQPIPLLKSAWPLRYGVHDERTKQGAFSWSIAY